MLRGNPIGPPSAQPFLAVEGVAKAYGGVQALKDVSLSLHRGEVHGLVGANGAGKSTLIRILAGLTQPDRGRILVDGTPAVISTPAQASALGLSFIHQELAFVPGMTVIENVTLGLPKKTRLGLVDWRAVARDVAPVAARVGMTSPLFAGVKGLPSAEKWLLNICRALMRDAQMIVMDEPTASLSAAESEKLFGIIEDLALSGVAVLYVSHRLDEIMRLCRRVTAFRDGRSVAQMQGAGLTRDALVSSIVGSVGRQSAERPPPRTATGSVTLDVSGLARHPRVKGVTFEIRRGEVLGIGGLVGAGRTELARLLYGADRADAGTMVLDGVPFAPRSPVHAVKAGLGLVPEERRAEGLVLTKSVAFNLQIANLGSVVRGPLLPLIDARRRSALARDMMRDLGIKAPDADTPVGRLSGGNQQKVLIGRWLLRRPKLMILDEPTRGVDVGSRGEIHRLIRGLAADGMAVLVISSEPDELPDLCDRVLVMVEGRLVRELDGSGVTRAAIIAASYAGASHAGVAP